MATFKQLLLPALVTTTFVVTGCATNSVMADAYDNAKIGAQVGELAVQADTVDSSARFNASQTASFAGNSTEAIAAAAGTLVQGQSTAANLRSAAQNGSQIVQTCMALLAEGRDCDHKNFQKKQ